MYNSLETSRPRDQTHVSCFAGGFFTAEPLGKPFAKGTIWCFYFPSKLQCVEWPLGGKLVPVVPSAGFPTVLLVLTQWYPPLCDPKDCSPPDSSVHGILQARILEWIAISFSGGSFQPKDQTRASCISCIGRWILYHLTHRGSPGVFQWGTPFLLEKANC